MMTPQAALARLLVALQRGSAIEAGRYPIDGVAGRDLTAVREDAIAACADLAEALGRGDRFPPAMKQSCSII